MFQRILRIFVATGLIVCGSHTGWCQVVEGPAINGNGQVTLQPLPGKVRMVLKMERRGKSAKEALAQLAERRDDVVAKLNGMESAKPVSIEKGRPQIVGPQSAYPYTVFPIRSDAPRVVVPMNPVESWTPQAPPPPPSEPTPTSSVPRVGYYPPPSSLPPPPSTPPTWSPSTGTPHPAGSLPPRPTHPAATALFRCSSIVTADWALEGETIEQLLVNAMEIKTRISECLQLPSLPGGSVPSLGPTLGAFDPYSTSPVTTVTPGWVDASSTCGFLFVARITAEERRDALRRAYAQAEADAAELAVAVGRELGEPLTLRRWDSPAPPYPAATCGLMVCDNPAATTEPGARGDSEITAGSVTNLRFRCGVYATFRLK